MMAMIRQERLEVVGRQWLLSAKSGLCGYLARGTPAGGSFGSIFSFEEHSLGHIEFEIYGRT
jgi:hypothetical protein